MRSPALDIGEAHRRLLRSWTRAGRTPQRVVTRARIVLLAADGISAHGIAKALGVNPRTAALWRRRYQQGGPDSLWRDAAGRGRKPTIDADVASRVRAVFATPPVDGRRWSIRRVAAVTGVSRASVHRIVSGALPMRSQASTVHAAADWADDPELAM